MVSTEEQRSFTNIGPGTPATVWRRHPSWTAGEPLTLEGYARVVVLAAHPDDESLGAGGLTNTAVASGLDVVIVCATDGEHSHPDSPTLTPAELAQIRAREGRAAATALGVTDVRRLELSDGDLGNHEDLLTTRLVELVGDGRGTLIVAPWRRDGHPDHEAAGRAAATAARRTGADLWEYPVWFWHWGRPREGSLAVVAPLPPGGARSRGQGARGAGSHQPGSAALGPRGRRGAAGAGAARSLRGLAGALPAHPVGGVPR